jgi:hypothetical protein
LNEKIIKDLSTLIIEAKKSYYFVLNEENTQLYLDDENSRADKLSRKMYSFVIKKEKKSKKKIYSGIKGKTRHSRDMPVDLNNNDKFTFSPEVEENNNNWEKLDNEQDSK